MRTRNAALAVLWLLASACGGDATVAGGGDEAAAVSRSAGSIGSETARAPEAAGSETPRAARSIGSETARAAEPLARDADEAGTARPGVIVAPDVIERGAGIEGDLAAGGGVARDREDALALCPVELEGVAVRVAQLPEGGALVFTAARSDVAELRARLRRFAELHALHGQARGGSFAPPGSPEAAATAAERHFADEEALIHTARDVRVVDVRRGARLEVRLDEPTRVAALRTELREDASLLTEGVCPLALQLDG